MSDSDDGLDILGRLVTEGHETRDLKNRRDELKAKRQRTIRQYEIRTGEILLETSPEPKPGHVTFAPDDKLVARIPFHAFPAEVPKIPPVSPAPATPLDALRFLLSPTRRSPARPENVDNRAFQLPPQDDDDDDEFTSPIPSPPAPLRVPVNADVPLQPQDQQLDVQQLDQVDGDNNDDDDQDLIQLDDNHPDDDPPDDDQDCFLSAMAASLLPPPFHGSSGSDPENWIETVKWYILTQRAPTEKAKIAIVGVLLQGEALRWFLQLDVRDPIPDPRPGDFVDYPPDAIVNFAQFRERFLDKFRRGQAELWREQSLIMNIKQRVGQKTEDFLEELQKAASSANVAPEQIMLYALSGLRKDVKLFCMSHELANIADLKRWGNVFDLCSEEK